MGTAGPMPQSHWNEWGCISLTQRYCWSECSHRAWTLALWDNWVVTGSSGFIIALRSSACAAHIICLHKTHTAIFSLLPSCRLQEVQHFFTFLENKMLVYVRLIISHFCHRASLLYECTLWHHEVPSCLTSGVARASCRQMAQSTKRGLGCCHICLQAAVILQETAALMRVGRTVMGL